jgi:hypothetical protein
MDVIFDGFCLFSTDAHIEEQDEAKSTAMDAVTLIKLFAANLPDAMLTTIAAPERQEISENVFHNRIGPKWFCLHVNVGRVLAVLQKTREEGLD